MPCGCRRKSIKQKNKTIKAKKQEVEFETLKQRFNACNACKYATDKHYKVKTLTRRSKCRKTGELISVKAKKRKQSCPINKWPK